MATLKEQERESIQNDLSDCLGLIDGVKERLDSCREDVERWLSTYPHIGATGVEGLNCWDMNQALKDLHLRLTDVEKRSLEWLEEFRDED